MVVLQFKQLVILIFAELDNVFFINPLTGTSVCLSVEEAYQALLKAKERRQSWPE